MINIRTLGIVFTVLCTISCAADEQIQSSPPAAKTTPATPPPSRLNRDHGTTPAVETALAQETCQDKARVSR